MTQQGPGWYPDGAGGERWWDGRSWSAYRAAPTHAYGQHRQQHGVQHGQAPSSPQQYAPPGGPPPKQGSGALIGVAVVLSLLLVGSLIWLLVLVTDSGDDGPADTATTDDASSETTEPEPEGPPTDATEEDFCDAVLSGEDYVDDDVLDLRDFGEELAEVGTPEDIDDEAREGFEIYLELFDDAGNRVTQDELADFDSDLSRSEADATEAFDDYIEDTCHDSNIYA